MQEKVLELGIQKIKGRIYYLGKDGFVYSSKFARGRQDKGKGDKKKESNQFVNREAGWLYFVDKQGDLSRTKMARGRKKKE